MDIIAQKQLNRFLYLKYLYERPSSRETISIELNEISKALSLNEEELQETTTYLSQEKLITFVRHTQVGLTHKGIIEIETALTQPDKPTEHFPINVINIIHASQFQIQQGTINSTQISNFSTNRLKELADFLAEIKSKLPDLNLSGNNVRAAEDNIEILEKQVTSPRPNPNIITECLRSLRNILEGMTGSMAASGIIACIGKLMGG